jgi:hypothetical protein
MGRIGGNKKHLHKFKTPTPLTDSPSRGVLYLQTGSCSFVDTALPKPQLLTNPPLNP